MNKKKSPIAKQQMKAASHPFVTCFKEIAPPAPPAPPALFFGLLWLNKTENHFSPYPRS
jgi:hypothetical protein